MTSSTSPTTLSESLPPLLVTRLTIGAPAAVLRWEHGWAVRMECAGHPLVKQVEIARSRRPTPRPSTLDADLLHVLVDAYLDQPRLAGRATTEPTYNLGWVMTPPADDGELPEEFAMRVECWVSLGDPSTLAPRLLLRDLLRAVDLSQVPTASVA